MRAGWDRFLLRKCLQIAALATIALTFLAILLPKIQQARVEKEAKMRIYKAFGLDENPIRTSPASPELRKRILRVVDCDALMTDMKEPRPLFHFILEPKKKIESIKKESREVRWTSVNMIKSAITNRPRRDAIRETWGGVHLWKGVQITTIFILGNTSNRELQQSVEQEFREFGDILQINAKENYEYVSHKTLAGMQWAGEALPSNWLYSSGDDDMALHVPNFVRFIDLTAYDVTGSDQPVHQLTKFMPILCIYAYSSEDPPARNPSSKWYMPNERYPPPFWPTYCRGGWYSIAVATVEKLYAESRFSPFLRLDDVWITGLMRVKMLATIEEIEDQYLWNAFIIPAPLSTRNDQELNKNVGESDLSKVIVSHMWGNVHYQNTDVTHSLREAWKKWKIPIVKKDKRDI